MRGATAPKVAVAHVYAESHMLIWDARKNRKKRILIKLCTGLQNKITLLILS